MKVGPIALIRPGATPLDGPPEGSQPYDRQVKGRHLILPKTSDRRGVKASDLVDTDTGRWIVTMNHFGRLGRSSVT